jgi:tripeptidyl-peptidase-1
MSFTKLLIRLSALSILTRVGTLVSAGSSYAIKERHSIPRSWKAAGRADRSENINLQIGLKQRNEGVVERHLLEISDPSHVRYGQHLSAKEIADIVRPSSESISMVKAWLLEHGITELDDAPSQDWISIVVSIETAEELLHTSYSKYEHVQGHVINRASEWSLPLHLHEHIDVVQPTTSFLSLKAQFKSWGAVGNDSGLASWWERTGKQLYDSHTPDGSDHATQVAAVCNASFVTPKCLRTVYGTINYTVQAADKNSIAINNYLNETQRRDDAFEFLSRFRPEAKDAAQQFAIEIINNAANYQGPDIGKLYEDHVDLEGNLDGQIVLGISWPTPMKAYSTGGSPPLKPSVSTPTNTNEPYLTFFNYVLAQDDLPYVFSSSYSDDEQSVPYSYAKRVCAGYAQLGARGISYFVSSGDAGVGTDDTCYTNDGTSKYKFLPHFPSSCPWVTSVGATANFDPEIAVESFASGAGFSNYFGMPAYQEATVNAYIASLGGTHDNLYNKSGRAYPDVAAQGNLDAIIWAGSIKTVGGTSASSPTFAAVVALVNDALLASGKKPLGFLNPWLYSKAYETFTDVTSGSSYGCNTFGFPAQTGWDAVTGFGTPVSIHLRDKCGFWKSQANDSITELSCISSGRFVRKQGSELIKSVVVQLLACHKE